MTAKGVCSYRFHRNDERATGSRYIYRAAQSLAMVPRRAGSETSASIDAEATSVIIPAVAGAQPGSAFSDPASAPGKNL
jgi:hypothetical protein